MGTSVEDYDDFRPCFFESADEEFYDAPAPSEDIWKKFELLPTPPRSPKHETIFSTVSYSLMPTTLEKLRVVSEMLDHDIITKTSSLPLPLLDDCPPKCVDKCCNFNSKLIHDCMWSGHNVPHGLKQSSSSDISTSHNTVASNTNNNTSSSSRTRSCSFSLVLDSGSCVDPNVAAVFPYPINDQTRQAQQQMILQQQQREGSLGAETPSDSDSDSSSDEEDEEIDVVTVADRSQNHHPVVAARPRHTVSRPVLPVSSRSSNSPVVTSSSSASAQVAAMHNYTATAPRTPPKHSSSYSPSSGTSSPRSSSSSHSRSLVQKRHRSGNSHHHHHHPSKKAKFTLSTHKLSMSSSSELRTVIHKYQRLSGGGRGSSRNNSSDSEDSDGRRAQHNVLERKRRNDLKSSFHRLRDAVPDLQSQERAAKVTILKKATDHVMGLRRQHQTLVTELDRQKRTNEALQRRLRQLRSK